jgi:hypothetical protein
MGKNALTAFSAKTHPMKIAATKKKVLQALKPSKTVRFFAILPYRDEGSSPAQRRRLKKLRPPSFQPNQNHTHNHHTTAKKGPS